MSNFNPNDRKFFIPEKYQDLFFSGLLVLLIYIFFGNAIMSGGFNASDNVASESFKPFLEKASNNGEFPQWIPYIFSGMPSFASLLTTGSRVYDIIPHVYFAMTEFVGAIFSSDAARVASFYAIYAIGMYLLMRSKKQDRLASFLTAFVAVFSTYVITWIMIGHNTKPMVIAMFPYVFLLMERLREKITLLHVALLIITVHIMLEGAHYQMIFYGVLSFGIYLIFEFVSRLIKKDKALNIAYVAGLLALAGGLSYLMSSDRFFSTQEYMPYSTRGSAPIIKADAHVTDNGGHDYEYATMYSYTPSECITFAVPSYYGFGRTDNTLRLPTQQGVPDKIPTYWGQKEIEDSPPYMGILVFALAIVGFIYNRKDIFVQAMMAIALVGLFLSFGDNLPVLFDFFYYYVPMFNKFRAPSMALAMMHFTFPILAGYGINSLINSKDDRVKKYIKYFFYGVGGFAVLGMIWAAAFQNDYISAVGQKIQHPQLQKELWSIMISDWFINVAILALAGALIWAFRANKIKYAGLVVLLIALSIFDMWRIDFRPMEVAKNDINKEYFKETDIETFLKQDNEVFRITDFTRQANIPAYFGLQNVGGYHSAKLRVYQDMLDNADRASTSYVTNPFLWNLLNVKYIIAGQNVGLPPVMQSQYNGAYVFKNPSMMKRAEFVNSVKIADAKTILSNLKAGNFNPKEVAFMEEDKGLKLDSVGEGASATVTNYENELIELDVTATGNNLLLLSEIYYPVAWKAYIDGNETEIYKTNFAFRSIVVPAGKHKVEFKYHSDSYATGRTLSMATNALTLLALLGGLFLHFRGRKKEDEKVEDKI